MKPLVVIPARGGSKRLPGKNVKLLNGKPLIHYTIEAAREVFEDKFICVSTDDPEIKKSVKETGLNVPFIRPAELATDSASSRDVLLHALQYYSNEKGYDTDTIILLQPTSPFRTGTHIKESLQLFHSGLDMVVSVKETKSNPYKVLYEETSDGLLVKSKVTDNKKGSTIPNVWELNGAIYVICAPSLIRKPISSFKKIKKYIMPGMASVDIDTEMDWAMAEYISNKNLS